MGGGFTVDLHIDTWHESTDKWSQDMWNKRDSRVDEFANEVQESLRDFFNEFVRIINRQIEYQYSEEAILETIEANEYLFLSNGRLIPAESYP